MKKMAGDFKRDVKELASSVKKVFSKPKPPTEAERKRAAQMAGAGGLSGRRRDSAREEALRQMTGDDRRSKR